MDPGHHPCFVELQRTGRLPSPQGVALRLIELSKDENVSNAQIAHVLKGDPALCGRLIKIANGASFGGTRPIASVPDALMVLGLNAVRQITLGLSLVSNYSHGACAQFDYGEFWARSLNAAIATQLLARNLAIAPPDELFVCGLLSRIGYLALATVYPGQYSEVLADHAARPQNSLTELEQKCFGIDHNELTRELMLDWRIPRPLAEPVARHEYPDDAEFAEGTRTRRLRDVVHLAHFMATMSLGQDLGRQSALPDLFLRGARLGIESDVMLRIADEVARVAGTWSSLLVAPRSAAPAAATAPAPVLGILVVCEASATAIGYQALFRSQGYAVTTAGDNQAGLRSTFEKQPDIVIVAMQQPQAMNFCRALRATALGRYPYLIVLASAEAGQHEVEAFEAGADAWLAHPLEPKRIIAQLHAAKRALGLQDDLRAGQQELRRLAAGLASQNRQLQQATAIDTVTGLPNRLYVRERLSKEWDTSQRTAAPLSCVWIEVDRLREIHDAHGQPVSNGLLKQVGALLKRGIPPGHVVCYLGDAAFLVICPATHVDGAHVLAQRLCRMIAQNRFAVEKVSLQVTAGAGVAAASPEISDWNILMQYARRALHFAAKLDGDRCAIHPLNLGVA